MRSNANCCYGVAKAHPTFLLIALCLLVASCATLKLEETTALREQDWLTEGDTPARKNSIDVNISLPLEEAWVYNAGAGFGNVSPLLYGKAVLAATRKGEVHAVNLETGKKIGLKGFGHSIESTPVIHKGFMYIASAWGKNAIQSYDLEQGTALWGLKGIPIEAGLLLHEDKLIAVDMVSNVLAFQIEDGSVAWQLRLDSMVSVHAAPVLIGKDRLIVVDDQGKMVAMRAGDGEVIWTLKLGYPVYGTPAAEGDQVYVSTTRGRLISVDAERGAVSWEYSIPDTTVRFAPPAIEGNDLYFGGTDGHFRSLDTRNGDERWIFRVDHAFAAPALVTRDLVFAGDLGRMLYALDKNTGAIRWERKLRGRIKSAMAAQEQRLIVLTEPRYVYMFQPKVEDERVSSP